MASSYIKALVPMLCINIILIMFGYIHTTDPASSGNSLSSFFSFSSQDDLGTASINPTFENKVKDIPSQGAAGTSTGFSVIDGIKLVLGLVSFLLATITAPFQLLFNPAINVPSSIRFLFGFPYTIIYIFTLIGLARGSE